MIKDRLIKTFISWCFKKNVTEEQKREKKLNKIKENSGDKLIMIDQLVVSNLNTYMTKERH